jgi:hypothetical protein
MPRLADGLTSRGQRSLQEEVGRLKDPDDVAPKPHVTRMVPATGLLGEQRRDTLAHCLHRVVVASGIDVWRSCPKTCQKLPRLPAGAVKLSEMVLVAPDS